MKLYRPGTQTGPLDHWPFDAPESDYRIIEGDPRASGRLDMGGPGEARRAGIWRCTPGVFECTEQGDELMTMLEGRCRIVDVSRGDVSDLGPGDSLFIRDGMRARWEVSETVTKLFFGWKAGGY